MSLEGFQRAFAEIVASPALCVELRGDETWLDRFDLDARERRRLLAMAWHRGMSHNCTLYRSNRLTPIARSLPGTCIQLGARLTAELEAFWASEPDSELQFKREAERFARFLLRRLHDGGLVDASIAEEVRTEMHTLERQFAAPFHP
jgi:hypothetical protein